MFLSYWIIHVCPYFKGATPANPLHFSREVSKNDQRTRDSGLGTRDSGLGWDEDFLDRQHARADADGKLQSHPALNNFRRNEKPSPPRRCLSSKYKGLGRREEGKKGV